MLNRYGLFDIEKILDEESDLKQFRAQHGDTVHGLAQDHNQIGKMSKMTGTGYMAGRFRRAPAKDSAVPTSPGGAQAANTDKRNDRDMARQTLRTAHQKSGMKAPFSHVFDQKTTGLQGQDHVGFISYIHDGTHTRGKNNRGRIELASPSDAQAMAKAGEYHHDDLLFNVDKDTPNVVNYKPGRRPKPEPQPPAPAPEEPEGPAGAMGPMGAPMGAAPPPQPPPAF